MRNLKICILGLALASCSRSEEEQSDTTGFSEPAPNYDLVYDDGLAGRLANAATTVSKWKVTEKYKPCWNRVWQAMRWTYGDQIEKTTVGRPQAYNFAEWANPKPQRLYDTFKLKKKSYAGTEIPVGSIVVWKPGSCGYDPDAGHIEIVVSPGTACSFYCGPICTSAVPEVYVPVKKQLRNEIINRYMKLMQTCACCSFPTSTMLVKSLECQRYRAVISMGVGRDASRLANPH